MSIFCCGRYNQSTEKIFLYSNDTYKNRYIEIVVCTNCQKKKAILHQERISDGKVIETKPKKGKVNSFIEKCLNKPIKLLKQVQKIMFPGFIQRVVEKNGPEILTVLKNLELIQK